VQPVGLGAGLGEELVAVVAEHLEVLGLPGVAGGWQVVLTRGDAGDRQSVGGGGWPRPRPWLGSAARFDRPRPAGHHARQGGGEGGGRELGAGLVDQAGRQGVL